MQGAADYEKRFETYRTILTIQGFAEDLNWADNVKLQMLAIPGGTFLMGSVEDVNAQPIHGVRLQAFFIGRSPITQGQWKEVMGTSSPTPVGFRSPFNTQDSTGSAFPVVVELDNARKFCKQLSERTGRKYRLPSEAEWEHAVRAGSTSSYFYGDDMGSLNQYAWYEYNSKNSVRPVEKLLPNPWGLYDVYGNVQEWCEDIWHYNYEGAPRDGSAWLTGENFLDQGVVKGGRYDSSAGVCKSSSRCGHYTQWPAGFRVACAK